MKNSISSISILLILVLLSSNSYAHYPEDLKCIPQYQLSCRTDVARTLDKKGSECVNHNFDSKIPFTLTAEDGEYSSSNYRMNTSWLTSGFVNRHVRVESVLLTNIDAVYSENSQSSETSFIVYQIGELVERMIGDYNISAFATLSGTSHPHTLQFIIAEDGMYTETTIFYAHCLP